MKARRPARVLSLGGAFLSLCWRTFTFSAPNAVCCDGWMSSDAIFGLHQD
ncbi:hypothetical protein U91I_01956 [alpha proteobacterium U9-1i]|nr:hypothetical protein U91I_01956 [alpha proteobacterium U9-1i]